jgi:hypothetical protein
MPLHRIPWHGPLRLQTRNALTLALGPLFTCEHGTPFGCAAPGAQLYQHHEAQHGSAFLFGAP